LQDPLADMLLRGSIPDGATVKVEEGDGGLNLAVT
jgi:ATP-dependent Clp protease ATP-binding subunit ClpB